MTDHDIETWKLGFEGLQFVAIVVGAGWAAWRFRRERIHAPQVEFSVDAKLHGPSNGAYAAEYVLTFENKGKTRVQITSIELRVRGIKRDAKLTVWKAYPPRIEFTEALVDDKHVIPRKYSHAFFEPGIKQEYRYVSIIPEEIQLILVRGQFFYKGKHSHSAERVISVEGAARQI